MTYRLADTLPRTVLAEFKAQKQRLLNRKTSRPLSEHRQQVHKRLFATYDRYLDQSQHRDWLRNPRIAALIRENLYHHDGALFHLHAYCVMPNHVHVLLTPSPDVVREHGDDEELPIGETSDHGSPLSRVMHSLKSYTANEANKVLKRTGSFWQSESYDHWVRDDSELERIVNYIRGNPVSAQLVERHEDWWFSSCHDRFLHDADTSGWLP